MKCTVSALRQSFFFSSRRRHTRLQGDWSSDVCSSDLGAARRPRTAARTDSREPHPRASRGAAPLSNGSRHPVPRSRDPRPPRGLPISRDRKSTRLNSSHLVISYAVFCLKKKKLTPHLTFFTIRRDIQSIPSVLTLTMRFPSYTRTENITAALQCY